MQKLWWHILLRSVGQNQKLKKEVIGGPVTISFFQGQSCLKKITQQHNVIMFETYKTRAKFDMYSLVGFTELIEEHQYRSELSVL